MLLLRTMRNAHATAGKPFYGCYFSCYRVESKPAAAYQSPKPAEGLQAPQRSFCCCAYLVHVWHQVVRHTNGVLANFTRGVGAHWVEVAQQQDAPVLVRGSNIPATASTTCWFQLRDIAATPLLLCAAGRSSAQWSCRHPQLPEAVCP